MSAIQFLTTVSRSVKASLFQNADTMQQVASRRVRCTSQPFRALRPLAAVRAFGRADHNMMSQALAPSWILIDTLVRRLGKA